MERGAQDGDQVNDGITSTAPPSGGEPIIEELNAQDGDEVPILQAAELAEKVRDKDDVAAPVVPVATVVTVEDATQEDPGRRREMKSATESTTTKVERVAAAVGRGKSRQRPP